MNKMQFKNATRETLWSLLQHNGISIPRMQRNYAQGRLEPDIKEKRDNLINDIFNSLLNDELLDLNFVYGNIKNNLFIPIDGQQRLTTLFLLHWYFMQLSNEYTDANKEILSRFSYETRDVTRQFCNRLVNDVQIDLLNIGDKKLSEIIKDYYWFFLDFESDLSISSMLVMLDTIHCKAMEIGLNNCSNFFYKLIGNSCPLSFLFLDIDDAGLTDEIYIKMNARGKPLTEFENFKALLTNYLNKKDSNFSDEFILNLNGVWSQFFWKFVFEKHGCVTFDGQLMNFLRFMIFNLFICNNNAPGSNDRKVLRDTFKNIKEESTFEFTNRLFKDEFRNVYKLINVDAVVDENSFKLIYKLLNILSNKFIKDGNLTFINRSRYKKLYFNEDEYFDRVIEENGSGLAYEDSVLLFAEYLFLIKYSDSKGNFDKFDELTDWIRYIYNLSRAQLYNQGDDYYRSIKSVSNLIENDYAINIIDYSASLTPLVYKQGRGFGFYDVQTKEESIKSNLIKMDPNWRDFIIEAEKSYLDNQLNSIINFAGIEDNYDTNIKNFMSNNPGVETLSPNYPIITNDTKFFDSFVDYLYKICVLFDRTNMNPIFEDKAILRRALLTFGGEDSYLLVKEGSNYSFLDDNTGSASRDYSFKRLLRDDNDGKRKLFKDLLDSINFLPTYSKKQIANQLDDIINNFCLTNPTSWKYYFVSMPEILTCVSGGNADPSGDFVFKKSGGFITMKSKDEILLCEGQSTRSMNREYYTYVLYLKAKKQNLNVFYKKDYTETAEKYLYFNNRNNERIDIFYEKDDIDNTFKYVVKKDSNISCANADINYILQYIVRNI